MKPNRYIGLILVAAAIGFLFASVSTRDFAMHLDRQVHDVTCSFTPGLSGPETGESGCLVTMVSPYSSVLRSLVWGGIPIALPGMALFAFLFAFATEIVFSGRQSNRRAAGLMALATFVPLATSMVMATISIFELDAVCKLCVGIYVSSLLCFAGGLGLYLSLRKRSAVNDAPKKHKKRAKEREHGQEPAFASSMGADGNQNSSEHEEVAEEEERADAEEPALISSPLRGSYVAGVVIVGLFFVTIPIVGYVAAAPDHSRFIGTCGSLSEPAAPELLIPLGPPGRVPAIEILDPLCPACRQFEQRITESEFDEQISRSAILFPLDDTCNWMVDKAMHPGACTVSRAILCAGPRAQEVIGWAFDEQDAIIAATKEDPTAAGSMVSKRFPEFAGCVESPEIEAKLNRSMRWAVSNQIRVLTPQLFVGGVKLCDEDVDIGLDFAMSRMIERHKAGTLMPMLEAEPEVVPAIPESATDTQVTEQSVSDTGPASDNPASDASDNPASDRDSPASDNPTSDNPASDNPASDNPASDNPASDNPASDNPASDNPASDNPASDNPASDNPASDNPASDNPASDNPASDNPASDNPASDNPASDNPASDNPASDNPASDNPASDNPASDKQTQHETKTPETAPEENQSIAARLAIAAACLSIPTVSSLAWVGDAEERLVAGEANHEESTVPVAAAANDAYCTPDLQRVLRRVLKSCGLIGSGGSTARGCEPVNAQQVATMSGEDFNALFTPMREHGGIIQFEQGESELDETDRRLIGEIFSDRRGASYFFMVARASPEGRVEVNPELSMLRAENLMSHLSSTFNDPDLDKEVGLLWLGEEFAQLNEEFCQWRRSGDQESCNQDEINRSAFVAWIDCRL